MTSNEVTSVTENMPAKPSKRRRRRRIKRDRNFVEFDKIPGVVKLPISAYCQTMVGAVVGDAVTVENPWLYIDKENIDDEIEFRESRSDFFPIKGEMQEYKAKQVLLGYVPNEESEIDEFYVCTTEAAVEEVVAIIEKIKKEREELMKSALMKFSRPWTALGSETEINAELITSTRALYEVEVESKYPIKIQESVRFRYRLAHQVRDGYIEMPKSRIPLEPVIMKRINRAIQAAPLTVNRDIQTSYASPKNAWTQYQYEYEVEELNEEQKRNLKEFVINCRDDFYAACHYNGGINLFKKDYESLVLNQKCTVTHKELQIHEYLSFTDVKRCKNKVITSISWHPFFTGVVACSYSDTHLCNFTSRAQSENPSDIVYNKNPVLIWSYVDALKPKLILQAHREVVSIAYCPYDAGLIVGGCRNGQIIVWDVKEKLKRIESDEVLTIDQQRYRIIMGTFMTWMKNTRDLSSIPVTAISDLQYSHSTSVMKIEWLPPFQEITKTGHFVTLENKEERSYQFASTSLDGQIKFWDMRDKPVAQIGEYRPQRKSRRLKRKPSALVAETSPYRILHRLFKPHYIVSVKHRKDSKIVPMTCFTLKTRPLDYVETNPNPNREFNFSERLRFEVNYNKNEEACEMSMCVGTSEGEFKKISWDGYEYSSGQVVSEETAKIVNSSKYHDGPVLAMSRWPVNLHIILTVGGKTFCIWHEELMQKPILWRKSKLRYTYANWNTHDPSSFQLLRWDGNTELWNLIIKSYEPLTIATISGRLLTGAFVQKIAPQTIAIADHNGSFRVYKKITIGESTLGKSDKTYAWFNKQKEILVNFCGWQERWKMRFQAELEAEREAQELKKKQLEEEREAERVAEELERERLEKEAAKLAAAKLKPPPGMYKEWAENKCRLKELRRMNLVLLHNKQLDPKTLREEQIPIKRIEHEEKIKRDRLKQKHQDADKIFREAVAMNFPHVLKVEPPPPKDPYAGGDSMEAKQEVVEKYNESAGSIDRYIKKHPFIYHFTWMNLVKSCGDRSQVRIDHPHKQRYLSRKRLSGEGSRASFDYENLGEEEQEEEELNEEQLEDYDNIL